MFVFLKAQLPGGAAGDLFEQRVAVPGHARKDGVFVKPHSRNVRKRLQRVNVGNGANPAPPTPAFHAEKVHEKRIEAEGARDVARKNGKIPVLAAPKPSAGIKHFYVSAVDGAKRALVAGPYASHEEAKARVEEVRCHAEERDPRAHFMAWGTAGTEDERKTPLGHNWKRTGEEQ